MLPNLTARQKETLETIETFISENTFPPTLSELQFLLKVSSNQAVINHLDGLEEKGYIERKKTARGIKILNKSQLEEDIDFLELLSNLAIRRKNKPKRIEQNADYSSPVSHSNNGEIVFGTYNDEQY